MDAVVDEGREVLLLDRVPQPQLGRDPVVEPVQDRLPVAALRGRREPEQLARLEVEQRGFAPDDVLTPEHPELFAYATLQYGLVRVRAALAWSDWLLDQLDRQRRGEPLTVGAVDRD